MDQTSQDRICARTAWLKYLSIRLLQQEMSITRDPDIQPKHTYLSIKPTSKTPIQQRLNKSKHIVAVAGTNSPKIKKTTLIMAIARYIAWAAAWCNRFALIVII